MEHTDLIRFVECRLEQDDGQCRHTPFLHAMGTATALSTVIEDPSEEEMSHRSATAGARPGGPDGRRVRWCDLEAGAEKDETPRRYARAGAKTRPGRGMRARLRTAGLVPVGRQWSSGPAEQDMSYVFSPHTHLGPISSTPTLSFPVTPQHYL